MNATPSAAQPGPVGMDLMGSMTEAIVNQVRRWSDECQRFLDWQRNYFLAEDTSHESRSRHETGLKRLLAVGRMLDAATSDSEFPDLPAAVLVKARQAQLRESWAITHPVMSAEDAQTLLAAHFKVS